MTEKPEQKKKNTRAEFASGHTTREKLQRSGFRMNRTYTQISIYVILTAVILFILIRIAGHLPEIFRIAGQGLHYARVVLMPLIGALALTYILYPVTIFLEKYLQKVPVLQKKEKAARTLAVLLTWVLLLLLLMILLTGIISSVSHEVRIASASTLMEFIEETAESLKGFYYWIQKALLRLNIDSRELDQAVQMVGGWFGTLARNAGNNLLLSLKNLSGILANMLFSIILSIYFLLDLENLYKYWNRVGKALTSRKGYQLFSKVLKDADHVFSGYIRGQLLDGIIMFLLVSIALSLVRVPFAIIIGILTGIGNLIPYLGPFIAYGTTAVSCLATGDWKKFGISILVIFVIQTIDGNVINPHLLSKSIDVHPILVLVSLIIGSAAGGLAGMLLAVPVAALLKLWFDSLITHLIYRRNHDDDPENDLPPDI